ETADHAKPTSGQRTRRPPRMTRKPVTSMIRPNRIIVVNGTAPVPYTIAFGGVEIGNMNERLAPRHVPSAGGTGLRSAAEAMESTTGTSMLAAAVLDVNSLSTIATPVATAVTAQSESAPLALTTEVPSASASPVENIS